MCVLSRVWPSPLPATWCLPSSTGTPVTSSRLKIVPTALGRRPPSTCIISLPRAPSTPSCGPCSTGRYCGWHYGSKVGEIYAKLLMISLVILNLNDKSPLLLLYWLGSSVFLMEAILTFAYCYAISFKSNPEVSLPGQDVSVSKLRLHIMASKLIITNEVVNKFKCDFWSEKYLLTTFSVTSC